MVYNQSTNIIYSTDFLSFAEAVDWSAGTLS